MTLPIGRPEGRCAQLAILRPFRERLRELVCGKLLVVRLAKSHRLHGARGADRFSNLRELLRGQGPEAREVGLATYDQRKVLDGPLLGYRELFSCSHAIVQIQLFTVYKSFVLCRKIPGKSS